MIYGNSFTAINGTGERISHAVGTAFQACLAKKQEMEKARFPFFKVLGSLLVAILLSTELFEIEPNKANMTLKAVSPETAFTEPASPVVNAMRRLVVRLPNPFFSKFKASFVFFANFVPMKNLHG